MPKIKANDTILHYERIGKGPPLLLIAGFTADLNVWLPLLDFLPSYFDVIYFDNRDVGQSDAAGKPYSVEDMAKDAVSLLDALKIPKADIIGHSMGTVIAQDIAVQYPDRLNRLVLLNSFAKINTVSIFAFKSIQNLLTLGVDVASRARVVLPWLFAEDFLSDDTKASTFVNNAVNNPYPQTLQGFNRQLDALKTMDTRNIISQILCPTLILAGSEDLLIPLANAHFLSEKISGSKLVVIPKTGHMSHIEQPKECADHILKFLS